MTDRVRRLRRLLAPALLAVVPVAVAGQAPGDALAILEAASARYAALTSLCAGFEQTLEVPLVGQTTRSRGELCQLDPNLFKMDFQDPAGDRIVADGTWLWLYFPSAQPDQVIRSRMAAQNESIDFHREFLQDPGVKYAPTLLGPETVGGASTHHLRLRPLQPSGYANVEVWLDTRQHWIRRIRIEQENGSVRTLDLADIRVDPPLRPGDFAFTPPPGATVVTG
ncbi:MAG: outer membrane lipoprotein carrier protein LolA [Gemmatimonadota bacterium]|nr:outer membrane lipoprotein carrier protein LolA [Gemmatimonadota bacterium]